jgi:hypothetical protein
VNNPLPVGNYSVVVNNVRDLNNNVIASNSVRAFGSFNPSTAPVVVEVYQDVGANTDVPSLTGHQLFTSGSPTFISYSNLFGFNVGFGSIQDNYGVKGLHLFHPADQWPIQVLDSQRRRDASSDEYERLQWDQRAGGGDSKLDEQSSR